MMSRSGLPLGPRIGAARPASKRQHTQGMLCQLLLRFPSFLTSWQWSLKVQFQLGWVWTLFTGGGARAADTAMLQVPKSQSSGKETHILAFETCFSMFPETWLCGAYGQCSNASSALLPHNSHRTGPVCDGASSPQVGCILAIGLNYCLAALAKALQLSF